jgi:hypothetical protein
LGGVRGVVVGIFHREGREGREERKEEEIYPRKNTKGHERREKKKNTRAKGAEAQRKGKRRGRVFDRIYRMKEKGVHATAQRTRGLWHRSGGCARG